MLDQIFVWIYCMPIPHTVFFLTILTFAFSALRRKYSAKASWKITVAIMLLLWFAAIIWSTVVGRGTVTDFSASSWIPFHSYYVVLSGGEPELLRSNFMNVILFYPAGLLACELLWKMRWKILLVTLAFALLSAGIEFCQYRFALGQAEVDDVIHNTLGAFLGAAVSTIHFRKRKKYSPGNGGMNPLR